VDCCDFEEAAGRQFTEQLARRELARYRTKGPGKTARLLCETATAAGPIDGTLLEIGIGIGALTFALLERAITRAIAVDASAAYLAAASEEAARRGLSDAIQFVHGDFLTIASRIPSATIVVLDRVVCCYPTWEPLVGEALQRADRYFAFSYPRDVWYVRAGNGVMNLGRQIKGRSFRTFVHPPSTMEEVIQRAGFSTMARRRTMMWHIDVYVRSKGSTLR